MLRADSSDLRLMHVEGLRDSYASVVVRPGASDLLSVDVTSSTPEYGNLTVYACLAADFPMSPPRITSTHGQALRCAPPGVAWNAQSHVLAEGVAEAFKHLQSLWGSVRPVTMSSLVPQLSDVSDDTLRDIARDPTCCETFAYQLPVCKQIREEERRLTDTIEVQSNTCIELAQALASASEQLQACQAKTSELLQYLNSPPRKDTLSELVAASTTEGIVKMFVSETRSIQQQSDELQKQMSSLDPSSPEFKKQLEEMRQSFLDLRKQFHHMELKRRSFAAAEK